MIIRAIFLSLSLSASALALTSPLRVVIDPGHGGNDKGATTPLARESDLTLKLSQKILALIIDRYPDQIQATVTRTKNHYLTLAQRIQVTQNQTTDLYLSLHYNSAFAESISGTEIYFPESTKSTPQLSVLESIKQDLVETGRVKKSLLFSNLLTPEWNFSKLKIRRAPFYILEKSPSPTILIEIGYLSNPTEQKMLLNSSNQDQMAESIVKALLSYKENRDNELN